MADLFIITASRYRAYDHFKKTIEQPVSHHIIAKYLGSEKLKDLDKSFAGQPIYAWGAKPGENNIPTWQDLSQNDYILVYVQGNFVRLARVALKDRNFDLAKELWGLEDSQTWEYMYFLKDVEFVEYSLSEFQKDLGFKSNYVPQGFSEVKQWRYVDKFGDLESLLSKKVRHIKLNPEQFKEKVGQEIGHEVEDVILKSTPEENEVRNELKESLSTEETEAQISKLDDQLKQSPPKIVRQAIMRIERNSYLSRLVKEQRGYKCQICGTTITKVVGGFYAEAHHLDELSDGGLDFSKNIVVVCPNCHKRCHFSRVNKGSHNSNHVILTIEGTTYNIPLTSKSGNWESQVISG